MALSKEQKEFKKKFNDLCELYHNEFDTAKEVRAIVNEVINDWSE